MASLQLIWVLDVLDAQVAQAFLSNRPTDMDNEICHASAKVAVTQARLTVPLGLITMCMNERISGDRSPRCAIQGRTFKQSFAVRARAGRVTILALNAIHAFLRANWYCESTTSA